MPFQRTALLMLAAVLLIVLFFHSRRNGSTPVTTAIFVPDRQVAWLQITGAVRHAGMYALTDNIVTSDVIKMAMPFCEVDTFVDLGRSSLNERVDVVMVVTCPSQNGRGSVVVQPLPAAQSLVLGRPFSLNRASTEDLMLLPEIGPVLAERIVHHRQNSGDFADIKSLLEVEGIGEKKLSLMLPYLKL